MSSVEHYAKLDPADFVTTWRAPSNIAFVKYWGKKGHQIPANPSLSMTLKECYTESSVSFSKANEMSVKLKLDGINSDKFAAKISKYLTSLTDLPWLNNVAVTIDTKNTFPHGTGIASSASGLAAFSLCLTEYLHYLSGEGFNAHFYNMASNLARLASGSASRSVFGDFTTWGECGLPNTSDVYATPFEVHSDLSRLKDSIVVVSGEEKTVSSTAGHGRMNEHPFAAARFVQAKDNFEIMVHALKSGDVEEMGRVLESEALSLHAMMLSSPQAYTLLKPNTLSVIEMIWAFRRETKIPLYFTLDAGPNLHLIYPEAFENKVKVFISQELSGLSEKIIHDEKGSGPIKC